MNHQPRLSNTYCLIKGSEVKKMMDWKEIIAFLAFTAKRFLFIVDRNLQGVN